MDGNSGAAGAAGGNAGRIARAALLVVLYATPAVLCMHGARVVDEDLGWHLRAGEWIAQHHAAPWTDPFSRAAAEGGAGGEPWMAYSWLFELPLFALHRRWGLMGVMGFSTAMVLAITVAAHRLIASRTEDVSKAALLTLAVMLAIAPLDAPRPWLCSVLLFTVELGLLLEARRSGWRRNLLWLPALFTLWANVHIQFVDGLAVLVLAAASEMWEGRGGGRRDGAWKLHALLAGCVAATLLNPYGWRIYQAAYGLASQKGPLGYLQELQAIPFRRFADYLLLAMSLAAAAALGRRRRVPIFEGVLLAAAAVLAFRSQRDIWLLAVTAGAVLAEPWGGLGPGRKAPVEDGRREVAPPWVAMGAIVVVALCGKAMGMREAELQAATARIMPAGAVAEILAKGYDRPVYNTYDWGGYLLWTLRRPVSLDGRAALYGDDRIEAALKTWAGEPGWGGDAAFRSAGLVIAPVKQPLTQLLRLSPAFRLVYEDRVAAVFVRRNGDGGGPERGRDAVR